MNKFGYLVLIWTVAAILCCAVAGTMTTDGRENVVLLPPIPWSSEVLLHVDNEGCSGTVIGRDLVLTAGHCVANLSKFVTVRFMDGSMAIGMPLARHESFCSQDWALVLAHTAERAPVLLSHDTPTKGTIYYRIGHPRAVEPETYAEVRLTNVSPVTLTANEKLIGGESGSPLLDSKGHLVGVAICSSSVQSTYFNTSYIIKTLDSYVEHH